MITKEFLNGFAERFGKTEQEKEDIRSSKSFYIDYLDGIFCLYNNPRSYDYIYHGGNNGCIFECEDYQYLWENLKSVQGEFSTWLNDHNLTDKDLMSLTGEFFDDGIQINCSFSFYPERFK